MFKIGHCHLGMEITLLTFNLIYKINQDIIYINMLPTAGHTAGPNGLKLFADTQGWPVDV